MEKTFEELIKDVHYQEKYGSFITNNAVIKLLQQVREATIAECIQTAKEELGIMSDSYFIKCVKDLPANRIKKDL